MTNETPQTDPDQTDREATDPGAPGEPGGAKPPSPLAMVIAAGFMTAPAAIPFYYAMQQDDATIKWVFIGAGLSLVVFNAIALVLIFRWLKRFVT